MVLFRWALGLPFAALVTTGLFFLMAQLIRDRYEPIGDPKPSPKIRITAEPPPEGPHIIEPPSKTLPEDIPEMELDFPKSERVPQGVPTVPAKAPATATPPGAQRMPSAVVNFRPPYPESCRSRGAEGIVIVEFDVTPEGNVVNPRIVDSANRCFNRTVLKTVLGWKYQPAAGGGMRYGLIERFNFRLEG